MNIVFRVDASQQIGTGHVMRCLTLAEALRRMGAESQFICRELPGHFCDYLEKRHFSVLRLPNLVNSISPNDHEFDASQLDNDLLTNGSYCENEQEKFLHITNLRWLGVNREQDSDEVITLIKQEFIDSNRRIDWLVVDHYALDSQWEIKLRPFVNKIMVIDDLADRYHDCDLLLDQNLYENMETRYDGLVSKHCIKLLGPKYALLRPEFRKARSNLRKRNGSVKRILVFFGGSDPGNETVKALQAIQMLERFDICIDVVVGSVNPHKKQIKEYCNLMPNTNFYCQIENMAELMAKADLAIGAGGSTTWERSCLGLPAITIITADNQKNTTNAVAAQNAIITLGEHYYVSSKQITQALDEIINNKKKLCEMEKSSLRIMCRETLESSVLAKLIMGDE